jgi:hypothetical protein
MSRSIARLAPLGIALLGLVKSVCAEDVTQTQPDATVAPNGAAVQPTPVGAGGAATTAATATPTVTTAQTGGLADTVSDLKRFFTITCDVREEYDDNIYASNGSSKYASLKEEISPSILFSYPMDNSTLDARYTFGYTYYNHHRPGDDSQIDHDVVLRYNHAFSDRFNLDLRDDGGYHIDPSLLQSLGAVNQEGGYYSNILTGEFTAQWTPLFGTVTSYSNNFISYGNGPIGVEENSDENTISQDFRFAFWPTVTFATGLIYDSIDYFQSDRGFSSYTANAGFDWQALPSVSLGFRLGGTLTTINQGGGDSTTPYASANVNWQLGERSRLIASYVHSVTPTDVFFAQGEVSDRFTANFLYNITADITAHLEGIYTYADYTEDLLTANGGSTNSFNEQVSSFDTGVTYHYNQYIDFEAGYIFSVVDSGQSYRDYTRNQIYLGVRGTY